MRLLIGVTVDIFFGPFLGGQLQVWRSSSEKPQNFLRKSATYRGMLSFGFCEVCSSSCTIGANSSIVNLKYVSIEPERQLSCETWENPSKPTLASSCTEMLDLLTR